MGKKDKKQKKVSAKREKYAKFRKEKPGTLDISMPDIGEEKMAQKREDDELIGKYLRFNKNRPTKEIVERRMKSKR